MLFLHDIPDETILVEFEEIMRYVADRRAAGELDVIMLSDLVALQSQ